VGSVGEADATELAAFFDLPATAMDTACGSAFGTSAAAAWDREPANNTSGIIVGPLEQAAADLKQKINTNSCFPAVIADLESLESAKRAEVAASNLNLVTFDGSDLVGAEIAFLNGLFDEPEVMPANGDCCATRL
jgi:hypothetical protein